MPGSTASESLFKGLALALLMVFLGSTVAAVGKHLAGQVSTATIVLAQYLGCFMLVMPAVLRGGRRALATTAPWLHLVRGVSGVACFYTYYLALGAIPLADATLLRNTAPLIVPLIILLVFRRNLRRQQWWPLLLGFGGIALILRPEGGGLSLWHLMGFVSGVTLAISMVSTRMLAQREPETRILFYYFVISLLLAAPLYATDPQPIPLSALPWLIYVGVAMYLTFVLYTRAYRHASAEILAPINYFAVVFAGLLDWLIWQRVPDATSLAGIALAITGGLLFVRSSRGGATRKTQDAKQ